MQYPNIVTTIRYPLWIIDLRLLIWAWCYLTFAINIRIIKELRTFSCSHIAIDSPHNLMITWYSRCTKATCFSLILLLLASCTFWPTCLSLPPGMTCLKLLSSCSVFSPAIRSPALHAWCFKTLWFILAARRLLWRSNIAIEIILEIRQLSLLNLNKSCFFFEIAF